MRAPSSRWSASSGVCSNVIGFPARATKGCHSNHRPISTQGTRAVLRATCATRPVRERIACLVVRRGSVRTQSGHVRVTPGHAGNRSSSREKQAKREHQNWHQSCSITGGGPRVISTHRIQQRQGCTVRAQGARRGSAGRRSYCLFYLRKTDISRLLFSPPNFA